MWRVTPCHIFALLEPCHEARGKSKINRRQLLRPYLATGFEARIFRATVFLRKNSGKFTLERVTGIYEQKIELIYLKD